MSSRLLRRSRFGEPVSIVQVALLVLAACFQSGTIARAGGLPEVSANADLGDASMTPATVAAGGCPDGVGPCCHPCHYSTGFESGEGFTAGAWIGDGNQGAINGPFYTWDTSCTPFPGPACPPPPGIAGHVSTANPFSGSQHLRLSRDPGSSTLPFGPNVDARVPPGNVADANMPPIGPMTVSMQLAFDTDVGPNFTMAPLARSFGQFVTRQLFFYYGSIYVTDLAPNLTNVPIGNWDTNGAYHKYSIHLDPCSPFKCREGDDEGMPCSSDSDCDSGVCRGRIDYLIDDIVVYQGTMWAGLHMDQLFLYSDNTGGVDATDIDIDDVEIIRGEPCLGACCDAFGTCTNHEFQESCDGVSFYPHPCGSEEAVCPPANMGACCDPFVGVCTETEESACPPDASYALGTRCDETECLATLGACCDRFSAACSETTESACTGNSTFSLGSRCAPGACDPDKGACCVQTPFDATCSVTKDVDCSGFFTPDSDCATTACSPEVIPTVSEWGLVILALVLLAGAKVLFGARGDHGKAQA